MSNIVAVYNVRICDFIHLAFPSIDHINSIRIIVFFALEKTTSWVILNVFRGLAIVADFLSPSFSEVDFYSFAFY